MKTFIKGILLLSLVLASIPIFVVDVHANQIGCSNYEVAWINDSGGFDTVACFNSFDVARNKMNELQGDHVVRHHASGSPSKIIAMVSGLAYAYSWRINQVTLNIYDNPNLSGTSTYVALHYPLEQASTYSYNGKGDGVVAMNFGGFKGYTRLYGVDLVPEKYLRTDIPLYLGGHKNHRLNSGVKPEDPFLMQVGQPYYTIEQNGNYRDVVLHYFFGWSKNGGYNHRSLVVGPASDWMSVGSRYYSADGINFYSDRSYSNLVGTYYNYYQYLSARSKTNLPAEAFNKFLTEAKGITQKTTKGQNYYSLKANQSTLWDEGATFIEAQNNYGVNALLLFAHAIHESGYGRSNLAVSKFNLFGWNAVDSNVGAANTFHSIRDGILEMAAIHIRGYMDVDDPRSFGSHYGNKGSGFGVKYASDPYWGASISSIAYRMDKVYNNYNGNLSDYNQYSVALVNKPTNFYLDAGGVNRKYDSLNRSGYQFVYTVNVNENLGEFSKVQSSNAINPDGSLILHKNFRGVKTNYNFNLSQVYARSSDLKYINAPKAESNLGKVPTADYVFDLSKLTFENNQIVFDGKGYRPGIHVNEENKIVHELYFINDYYEETKYDATTTIKDKEVATFNKVLNLQDTKEGKYTFKIKTNYSKYTEYNEETYLNYSGDLPKAITLNQMKYELTKDDQRVYLTVSKEAPKPPVVNEPEQPEVKKVYNVLLTKYEFNDIGKLTLRGVAMVEGLNHDQVKHQLEVYDLFENRVAHTFDLQSHTGDYNLSDGFKDGFNYDLGWFEGTIDTTTFEKGNYKFNLITTIQEERFSKSLFASRQVKELLGQTIHERYYSLRKEKGYSNRFELLIDDQFVAGDKTTLPSIRESYLYVSGIKFNTEANTLTLAGTSFIWNVDATNMKYKLYLMNKDTNEMKTFEAEAISSLTEFPSWKHSENITSSYNYDTSWFSFDLPLDQFDGGRYDAVLRIENGSLIDYIDLRSSSSKININQPSIKVERIKHNKNILEFTVTK